MFVYKMVSETTFINPDTVGFINFIEMMELKTDHTTDKLKIQNNTKHKNGYN